MSRAYLRKLAPNQYQYSHHILTIVRWRGDVRRELWDVDSDADERARWVARAKSDLRDRAADAGPAQAKTRGTLTADVRDFLKTRAGRAGYAADKSHLKAWETLYGPKRRALLTTRDVDLAIAGWRSAGAAAYTIRHRCRALRVLWRHFDGPRARTPVDAAAIPKKPQPHPIRLPAGTIQAVADALLARCAHYQADRMKTYARFLVLAMTAQRPDQMRRARPEDVDLTRGVWMVRSAKGEPSHPVFFNDDIRHAFETFIQWNAWGSFNGSRYRTQLRAAGYPAHISTYNIRHEAAADALERGADLGDVQGFLGHTDIETTRRTYGPLIEGRQRRISALMGKRLRGHAPEG